MKGSLSSQGLISEWNFRTDLPLPTNTAGYRTPTGYVVEGGISPQPEFRLTIEAVDGVAVSAELDTWRYDLGGISRFSGAYVDEINRSTEVIENNLDNGYQGLRNIVQDWLSGDDNLTVGDELAPVFFNGQVGDDVIGASHEATIRGGSGDDVIYASIAYPGDGSKPISNVTAFGDKGSDTFRVLVDSYQNRTGFIKVMDFTPEEDSFGISDFSQPNGSFDVPAGSIATSNSELGTSVFYQGQQVAELYGVFDLNSEALAI